MNSGSTQSLSIGTDVHWYTVQALLGEGGFGITYAAIDNNLQREVALKEFFPADFARRAPSGQVHPGTKDDEELFRWGLQRFLDEARTLARFNHPNIVRVLSVFEQNGTAYMAMERIRGKTLGQVIKDGQIHSESVLLPVVHALLSGLQQVHASGVVHRDIKPDNIILNGDFQPVLLDFGSARQPLQDGTPLTALVTRGYAPFEQYSEMPGDTRQGPWTDIYGLAACLYFVVTGRRPTDAITRGTALLEDKPDPLIPASTSATGGYSATLLGAIDAGLSFEANARPQSAADWFAKFPGLPPDANDTSSQLNTFALPQSHFKESVTSLATERLNTQYVTNPDLDVLLVDDDRFVLNLTKRVLARIGLSKVSTAISGRDALAELDARPDAPQVIICDLDMPGMDGIEVMRHLGTRNISCGIILAGGVDSNLLKLAEGLAKSHGLNVLGTLEKPATPARLKALLDSLNTTRRQVPLIPQIVPISEQELIDGFVGGAVDVVFQPKVRIENRRVVGVEALARWQHPKRGQLGPGAFVDLAEQTGHMETLTEIVLRKSLAFGAEWLIDGLELHLSVNLSADSLKDLSLPERIVRMAEEQGFSTNLLTLEITETK
ncbi:MAG: serine/threonine protein kinase, partial [Gammaproteobacteria bacterium]